MKKRILFVLIILFALQGMAQKLPNWVNNKPTPSNDTYLYVVESGIGQTELKARNLAIAEVFRSTAMRIGQRYDSEEINQALQKGEEYKTISTTYNIPINKVCEFTEIQSNGYKVYVLCQVAKTGEYSPVFDEFNDCYGRGGADDILYVDGWDIYNNGKLLSDSEIRALFANSKSSILYIQSQNLIEDYPSSKGPYLVPFVSGVVIDYVWFMVGVYKTGSKTWDDFVAYYERSKLVFYGGAVLAISGFVLPYLPFVKYYIKDSLGRAKIRKAVNLYNNSLGYSRNSLEMEIGLAGNGVFLSFSF